MMRQHAELLERRTGQGVPEWRARITQQALNDEPARRPILDRLIEVAEALDGPGQITVQARKGFVTLQTRRRKFAVIRPATKTRVALGLRTELPPARGTRFQPADPGRSNDMRTKVALSTPQEIDAEITAALRQAYAENQ